MIGSVGIVVVTWVNVQKYKFSLTASFLALMFKRAPDREVLFACSLSSCRGWPCCAPLVAMAQTAERGIPT